MQVGLFSLVFAWRTGGYIVLVGIVVHFAVRWLAIAVFADAEGDLDSLTLSERALFIVSACFQIVAFTSILFGTLGWPDAAYLAILGLAGLMSCHVAVGMSAYRRVMAHEWPRVEPLVDDDW